MENSLSMFSFLMEVTIISLSGVMAPGPMTAVTIGKGNKSPHAGVKIAMGHGIIEFPLMLLVFFGFGFLFKINYVKPAIAFIGGLLLLYMGINMIQNIKAEQNSLNNNNNSSSLKAGIFLSAGNPYFLIWWATVGATIVLRSVEFGILGFVLFAIIHWSCDFIWLYILSSLSYKGSQFFGKNFQKISYIICAVLLIFFSFKFIIDAVLTFLKH
jgi:threonine/homoserine/homoserine lactone efflux protein